MKTKFVLTAIATTTLLAQSAPLLGHHSFAAEFDANQPVKLTGAVTKVEWVNPHIWFYVDVKDETGKITNWAWEMGSPNVLLRLGWTRNSLKPGQVVTVEGSRAKDGSNVANARSVMLDGKRILAGSSQGVTP